MTLDTPVQELPKIGTTLTKALNKLGIFVVRDLLYHFPYRYLDFRKTTDIDKAVVGEVVTIRGWIKQIQARRSFRSRLSLCEAVVSNNTGSIKVVWFNQPYLAKTLKKDEEILLSGKVEHYKTLQLTNPVYEKFSEESVHTGRLVPVYHSTESVPNRTLRNLVFQCLPLADDLEELLPEKIRQELDLADLSTAVSQLHFPEHELEVTRGRFRIAVDDVFPQQLAVQLLRLQQEKVPAYSIEPNVDLTKKFLATLPFTITDSQKRAAWDIFQDMSGQHPMNRLLQGDVGSGKTLVALLAALQVGHAGLQTAILAPTEILARQHYQTIQNYLKNYPHQVGLLTRNFQIINDQEVSKTEYKNALSNGSLHISIGTHAQLQEDIKFANLALVVIDEQHRFGVGQRSFLKTTSKQAPHLLSMSATPIPRTLALSLYGNLAVSVLKQVPSGRKPIITQLVTEAERDQAYQFVKKQIAEGRQAFIITPRVEDSETSEVRSVKKEFERLSQEIFPNFKLGLVYGKMKGSDKDQIMSEFSAGQLDVLVATSVIEIGIDVPNSTVMIIEGAESFGLAQLHQLRGRVGRSEHQSYCFLFTTSEAHLQNERLQVFAKSTDGFALAELDLEQRGFGDLFGKQQTGFTFRFPRFVSIPALQTAKQGAELLIQTDPKLNKHPELSRLANQYLEEYHGE